MCHISLFDNLSVLLEGWGGGGGGGGGGGEINF